MRDVVRHPADVVAVVAEDCREILKQAGFSVCEKLSEDAETRAPSLSTPLLQGENRIQQINGRTALALELWSEDEETGIKVGFSGAHDISRGILYMKMCAELSSRWGMLLIYGPAFAAALYCAATAPQLNGRELLVAFLLALHFGKRVAEGIGLHKYSGSVQAAASGFIGFFYALVVLLICSQQHKVPASLYAQRPSSTSLALGLCLFALGEAGNLYHHALLARLRSPREQVAVTAAAVSATPSTADALAAPPAAPPARQYTLPRGGMFELVTMPHYFFELVAWLGIALVAQQANALLVFAGMVSYLSGRAVATTQWYMGKFGKSWPASRRHIVPFLF